MKMALYLATVALTATVGLVSCRNYEYQPNQPSVRYDASASRRDYKANHFGRQNSDLRAFQDTHDQNDISDNFDYSKEKDEDDELNSVPGIPGKDYPNLASIPETSFSCADKKPGGYYADVETGCQVFHVCNVQGIKSSFLCSPGSIFNQKYFVCDWWYDVECENARDLYSLNEQLNRLGAGNVPSEPDIKYQKYGSLRKDYRDDNLYFNDLSLDASRYSSNHENDSTKSYREKVDEQPERPGFAGRNFPEQLIVSGNRRENGFPRVGSNANYLSATGTGWGPNSSGDDGEVPSFNGKERQAFRDEHLTFRQNYQQKLDEVARNSLPNERRFLDNIPRGFSKNYGLQSNQNDYANNIANFINQQGSASGPHFEQQNQNAVNPHREDFRIRNSQIGRSNNQKDTEPGIVYVELKNPEDEYERKLQKNVDDTILFKKQSSHFAESNQESTTERYNANSLHDDFEANQLMYEKPPYISESLYSKYNNEFSNPSENLADRFNEQPQLFFEGKHERNEETTSHFYNVRKSKPPKSSRIRPTGGLRDGLGNGFPSPNRELVGSNAIAGIGEPKLSVGQRPDYANRYPLFGDQHVRRSDKF